MEGLNNLPPCIRVAPEGVTWNGGKRKRSGFAAATKNVERME
jgi:hypothetical protein